VAARFLMLALLGFTLWPASAHAQDDVWFSPANEGEDFIKLFQSPDLWATSRSQIKVLKFGPRQVGAGKPELNSLQDMQNVDAFAKLKSWGIDVAIEAGAIKPGDCAAVRGKQATVTLIKNVKKSNGLVRFIAMDEPIASGRSKCGEDIDEIANNTAAYMKAVSSDPELEALGSLPEVGDIEGYPSTSVQDIERFVQALESRGAKPKFFHLDANVHRLDVLARDGKNNEQGDLRELKRFFQAQGIPLGIIFWPGYNPVATDKIYYDRTMEWVRRVHKAIGKPDQSIFQSWVVRGGKNCSENDPACSMTNPMCSPSDPPECGKKSVPVTVPDNNPQIYSETRLIKDALKVLNGH
jgi:hypothetical protein